MNLELIKNTPSWEWPEAASDILKEAVSNKALSEADRIAAVSMAGDLVVMNDEMAELLLSILDGASEPVKVRCQAAISLGPVLEQTDMEGFEDDFSDPPISEDVFQQIRERLHAICLDQDGAPKELRRKALEASVRATEDWHADAIRQAYSNSDADWKLTAVFCMQYVRGFEKETLETLQKPADRTLYVEAIRAAGGQELTAAWPTIKGLLTDRKTPKSILLEAIAVAPKIRAKEATELLETLSDSDDEDIAEAADDAIMEAETLAEMEEDKSSDHLN